MNGKNGGANMPQKAEYDDARVRQDGGSEPERGYDPARVILIVIVALTPCFMMGVYVFGIDMLTRLLPGCAAAVVLTWVLGKPESARRSKSSAPGKPRKDGGSRNEAAGAARDMSESLLTDPAAGAARDMEPEMLAAVVSGALVMFGMPSTIPIWIALTGAAASVLISRAIGYCTGLLARAMVGAAAATSVLWFVFREEMDTWPLNDFVETRVSPGDIATGSTPLQLLMEGGDLPGLSRMVVGFVSGPCGEVSVAAVLIGGCYLLWKRVISPLAPLSMLAAVFAGAFVYYAAAVPADVLLELADEGDSAVGAALYMALYHVLSGGAVFGAFFLAPMLDGLMPARGDGGRRVARAQALSSDTVNKTLTFVSALGAGVLTIFFRVSGICTEGTALPILVMFAATGIVRSLAEKIRNRI